MEQKRILMVDDEPDIRTVCRILLENHGYAVLEAENGEQAVETVKKGADPDLIILDIMMPQLNGFDAAGQIRRICAAPILFLTAKIQERDKRMAYDAGGDDFLAKPFSNSELLMKADALVRRYRVYKGKVTGKMLRQDIVLDEENRRVLRDGEPLDLTETEFSIIRCLAANRGNVVSVQSIYEQVWHEKFLPASGNTVMVHIVNLRKKLEQEPSAPQLIRTVWGKGYQIDE